MDEDYDSELLCIGNALVDIFARGEDDIDRQLGLDEPVQHISMEKMREILSVLPEFSVCSGGGAANVAKISGLLGVKTGFIGALGAAPDGESETRKSGIYDQFGSLFERELEEAGVSTNLIRKNSPTGICLILQMPDGRNIVAASPSAALELSQDDIDEKIIRQADAVVLDGFMMDRQPLFRHILELADKYGTAVALDLSTTGLAHERAVEIITYARAYPLIIFMNEDEAAALYAAVSRQPIEKKSVEKLWPQMTELFKDFTSNDIYPVLAVKLGPRGAVVFANGSIYRQETIPVIPLETTGAGDTFCAAFLAAWIREKSFTECADFGNRAARLTLDVNGTHVDPKAVRNLAKLLK